MTALTFAHLLSLCAVGAAGGEWTIDRPCEGVLVLRDDTGAWGGFSMGVAHQQRPEYQVRKRLDLTALPAGALERARAARLRVYLAIQDYSWAIGDKKPNGLDEAFEIVAGGRSMRLETADRRLPSRAKASDPLYADWVDFDLPLDLLRPGPLEVILRKLPGGKNDDYLYPGIDNSVRHGHSATSFDGGKTWREDRLNSIDAQGEFMIRLVLCETDLHGQASWEMPDSIDDPSGWIAYRGRDDGALRLEPRPDVWDRSRAMVAGVSFEGKAPAVRWLDLKEKALPAEDPVVLDGAVRSVLTPARHALGALEVVPPEGCHVSRITVDFERPAKEPKPVVDLRPDVAPPRGSRRSVAPACRVQGDTATLENGALEAVFQLRPTLALESLHVAELDRNVLARPERSHLFRIRVGDKTYGCHDAKVISCESTGQGFRSTLLLEEPKLRVALAAEIEADELRLGLEVTNAGEASTRFHVAFPHLAGIELSDDPAGDYYLFPWGGGVIADVNTTLRTAYGENTCWWQMIDLFSPTRGGGVYLRSDDPTGLYKCPALRKGETVHGDYSLDETGRGYIEPELMWRNALQPDPGLGVTFDFLRRERAPGESFRPPDGCLGTHAGDWRAALGAYVDWSHRTWPPRPYPSKLTHCWHVHATGWGQSPLFKDGAYRTDYLVPRHDVAEMMSWWSWSELGPWGTPMERLKEELGEAFYDRYKSYWVREPATGKLMYPLNRGDYDGYMPGWGGLPALREHIERVREAGILPMFYTDPILACANTKLGSRYGPTYGIMNPLWKDGYNTGKTPEGYVGSYGGYNMCLDTEWYSSWVAEAIARVCRETGVDGVRLDEYGHRGYVCHSDKHEHLFAEPGHNAWLQALARNVRQVHAAMDRVRPGLVLTTEFPGNDQMAAALEGAIVYDVRRVGPVRPTPVNLFRFYFPECKVFEIDRPARPEARAWMLFSATGAFSAFYPEGQHVMLRENVDAFERLGNEPLVPTLIPRVYANRFGTDKKRIVTLHNATGHTVDGPVLAVECEPSCHFIELLTGRELVPQDHEGRKAIRLKMKRDETVVIARLPRLLEIRDGLVYAESEGADRRIVVAAADGSELAVLKPSQKIDQPEGDSKPAPTPVMIKLLASGRLADAIPWPSSHKTDETEEARR